MKATVKLWHVWNKKSLPLCTVDKHILILKFLVERKHSKSKFYLKRTFCRQYCVPVWHVYQGLRDKNVEISYTTTPHTQHQTNQFMILVAGKFQKENVMDNNLLHTIPSPWFIVFPIAMLLFTCTCIILFY